MGEVYLAKEQGLARQVALKVLPAAARISRTQVKRFLLEAQAAAQLSHDHIVPIYHIGQHEGIHYFTMALHRRFRPCTDHSECPAGRTQ